MLIEGKYKGSLKHIIGPIFIFFPFRYENALSQARFVEAFILKLTLINLLAL